MEKIIMHNGNKAVVSTAAKTNNIFNIWFVEPEKKKENFDHDSGKGYSYNKNSYTTVEGRTEMFTYYCQTVEVFCYGVDKAPEINREYYAVENILVNWDNVPKFNLNTELSFGKWIKTV